MILTDCESYFRYRGRLETRLGVNELHGVPLFLRFSVKFVNVSVKFGSLHVQTRNNWEYMIFITCKLYYHVAHVKRKKKKAFGLNIWFMQSYRNSDFVVIYALFLPNSKSEFTEFTKNGLFKVCSGNKSHLTEVTLDCRNIIYKKVLILPWCILNS